MSLKLMAASFDKMMMIANNIHMCVNVHKNVLVTKNYSLMKDEGILLSMYCC